MMIKHQRLLLSLLISGILTSLIFGISCVSYYQKNGRLPEPQAFLMEDIVSELEGDKSGIYQLFHMLYFLEIVISFIV